MSLACSARRALITRAAKNICCFPTSTLRAWSASQLQRSYHDGDSKEAVPSFLQEYKTSFTSPRSNFQFREQIPLSEIDQVVTATGFLGKLRRLNSMRFAPLRDGLHQVQIFANPEFGREAFDAVTEIPENSAISVTGILGIKNIDKTKVHLRNRTPKEGYTFVDELEIRVSSIRCLNTFPSSIRVDGMAKPELRHLRIRFDNELRHRLRFRSDVIAFARQSLEDFQEVETPILFKSTPEGAREFIVPTRRRGYVYSLPQSPQQYKQILMASGINKYVQFAKCFRDEDHRADRQPEFTQIDLEMAWSDGEDVMQRVETFIKSLWEHFAVPGTAIQAPLPTDSFLRMKYSEAMAKHGSDKPDLRIKNLIHRVEHIVPSNLISMLTDIENPILEICKFHLDGSKTAIKRFLKEFMDTGIHKAGVFIYDSQRPLEGLQAFGFEGAEQIKAIYTQAANSELGTDTEFEDGDILFVKARPNLPTTGGSTPLGQLRLAFDKAARQGNFIETDDSHNFLWVTDFPLFTKDDGTEIGQEGKSGFSSTHHPFTAPKSVEDVDMLLVDPLKVTADHYDLVLNGVELGGGSRRIHNAEMQKFIMEKILEIPSERMESFSHLLAALQAGCPPHAGLALGFDRLVAMMQGQTSVREVIAFPKDQWGKDPVAQSPSRATENQLSTYHLQLTPLPSTNSAT